MSKHTIQEIQQKLKDIANRMRAEDPNWDEQVELEDIFMPEPLDNGGE